MGLELRLGPRLGLGLGLKLKLRLRARVRVSSAALASGMSITVPHPTITLPSYFLRKLATWSRQPGVVSVNSTMSNPPSMAACMAGAHCSAFGVRRTAQALYLANVSMTFCADAGVCLYAPEARVFMPRDDCINRSAIGILLWTCLLWTTIPQETCRCKLVLARACSPPPYPKGNTCV